MLSLKRFTFNPVQENTYVLLNEKDACCIIDPGCYFEEEKLALEASIRDSGLVPKLLLNTHCHLDHVFGNNFVAQTFGLTLEIGEKEQPTFDYAPTSGEHWGMPFDNYSGPILYLKEGDIVRLDEDELEVLFTPGHSVGHICFYCRKQGFVIDGDVLFKMSVGRTDIPGGDHELLIQSIREKLMPLPDGVMVYPGHGEPTTIGYERKHNMFLR
jgi:hydroxyacylglutathione hydrolase